MGKILYPLDLPKYPYHRKIVLPACIYRPLSYF